MKLSDLFRFATDNLRRRKGRTALTVIGVVVGVSAIVVMVSLGIAVNRGTDAMLQSWADLTKITIYSSFGMQGESGAPTLDDKAVADIKNLEHVVAASPLYHSNAMSGTLYAGRNDRYEGGVQLTGMDPEAVEPLGYTLVSGSYLSGQALGQNKIPVLVEQQIVFNFYDTKKSWQNPDRYISPIFEEGSTSNKPSNLPIFDANGNMVNAEDFFFDITDDLTFRMTYGTDETSGEPLYRDYTLVPVGVIDAGQDYNVAGGVVMSISDMKKLEQEYKKLSRSGGGSPQQGSEGYSQVLVKVDNVDNTSAVEAALKEQSYQISSMGEIREQMQGQVAQTQMMLGSLAAVSLLVAALNIANTMTMAIYERTREIGVMKVLGCRLKDIRTMFLIESGAIGLIGGVIGVALSLTLSLILNNISALLAMLGIEGSVDVAALFGFGDMMSSVPGAQLSIVPPWLVLLGIGFATVVGLLSGIPPAGRAVKISALEAIRHE